MTALRYPIEVFSTIFLTLFCLGLYIFVIPDPAKKTNVSDLKIDASTQTEPLKSDKRMEIKNILN